MDKRFYDSIHDMKNTLEEIFSTLEICRIKGAGKKVEKEDKEVVQVSINSFMSKWNDFSGGVHGK